MHDLTPSVTEQQMTMRERVLRILRYEEYDWMPVVHFGFWDELYDKWEAEGRIPGGEERKELGRGNGERMVAEKLGFDIGWGDGASPSNGLHPGFQWKILRTFPDGSRHVRQSDGVTVMDHPGVLSIPSEVDHLLKDRASWEEHYLPRLQWIPDRIKAGDFAVCQREDRAELQSLYAGSLIGWARNWIGIEGLSYMLADDPELVREIIDTIGGLLLRVVGEFLERGAKPDYLHFWEDICFNKGPLVNPAFFREACAPWYGKITDVARKHGVGFASVDCDGCIDSLVPIWLENGVNVMFPIEVGTWAASIRPWREKFGREIRGVGGMDKRVFAIDRPAIDAEIERLRPLVDLGGYIPCPDHRIPLEAEWDLVRYYCDRMHEILGGRGSCAS